MAQYTFTEDLYLTDNGKTVTRGGANDPPARFLLGRKGQVISVARAKELGLSQTETKMTEPPENKSAGAPKKRGRPVGSKNKPKAE